MANLNILSHRYVTRPINDIFSELQKTWQERIFWVEILKAERVMGVDIPLAVIDAYESAIQTQNLERIREIERITRHDIKAKIEAFGEAAGVTGYIHRPLTSRDLTDNVEQWQYLQASKIIFGKHVAILQNLLKKADEYRDIVLTARTHHQPAQATMLGRRFSMWAEENLEQLEAFERWIDNYPMRGIKGPVGTQFDLLTLLGSDEKVKLMEEIVANKMGFKRTLKSPGQVYPRSLDYQLASILSLVTAGTQNFANAMRLMSGYELVTEGFKEGQVGSSAMPHKMNTRTSERIDGLANLLKMYAFGASLLSGDQWEEGDVSCSVPRRVIGADSFYASDGLCEATLTVLNEMGHYPVVIDAETDKYLPFLATTEILNIAQDHGMDREQAHAIIKEHAVEAAKEMRYSGRSPTLATDIALNPEFMKYGISHTELEEVLEDKAHFVGRARGQITEVKERAAPLLSRNEKHRRYQPQPIL